MASPPCRGHQVPGPAWEDDGFAWRPSEESPHISLSPELKSY